MKLKSLLFVVCFALVGHVFAANQHVHPKADEVNNKNAAAKSSLYPDYCEIEIINNTYDRLNVYGVFDDGAPLRPFTIYGFEPPHYISLFYYGYCHSGMYLTIESVQFPYNEVIYDRWTPTESIVRFSYVTKELNGKEGKGKTVKIDVSAK